MPHTPAFDQSHSSEAVSAVEGPPYSRYGFVPSGVLLGMLCAALALAPGLFPFNRSKLANHSPWADEMSGADLPFVVLPVNQLYLLDIFETMLLGGVFAGLVVRMIRPRRDIPSFTVALGVLVIHGTAILQTFRVIDHHMEIEGMRVGSTAVLYITAMLGLTLVFALAAQVGFWLIARSSSGVAALVVALAASSVAAWVVSWWLGLAERPHEYPQFLPEVMLWLPTLIVIVALIWCGLRPLSRLGVWIVSLLALWLAPVMSNAAMYTLEARIYRPSQIPEAIDIGHDVFLASLGYATVRQVVAAALIAATGVLVLNVLRARGQRSQAVALDTSTR